MKSRIQKFLSVLLAFIFLTGTVQQALAYTLILPEQLKIIEGGAFEGDQSIDEVLLPEGIEEIYDRAFADSSVTRINLPDSLTWISEDAFDGAPNVSFSANTGTRSEEAHV